MAVFSLYVQLEDILNRTSPFSIWINGEKMDFLQQEGQRQDKALTNLEEKYTEMADGVDSIVSDSMKVNRGHRQRYILATYMWDLRTTLAMAFSYSRDQH